MLPERDEVGGYGCGPDCEKVAGQLEVVPAVEAVRNEVEKTVRHCPRGGAERITGAAARAIEAVVRVEAFMAGVYGHSQVVVLGATTGRPRSYMNAAWKPVDDECNRHVPPAT
ncbi:MAG: hypothetical protein H0T46_09395 [Deltaproteobacteria bacterium]|nr:hypothetical protein [Deltaproteobacteria bacterium]